MQLRFTLHGPSGPPPLLMHRIAALASRPLAQMPHSGAIPTLLSTCGATMRGSYRDIAMVIVVGPLLALVAAIALGKAFGAF